MVRVQKLNRPNKRSGYPLEPGKTTDVKGLVITNKTKAVVYVDKFTPGEKRRSRKVKKK